MSQITTPAKSPTGIFFDRAEFVYLSPFQLFKKRMLTIPKSADIVNRED